MGSLLLSLGDFSMVPEPTPFNARFKAGTFGATALAGGFTTPPGITPWSLEWRRPLSGGAFFFFCTNVLPTAFVRDFAACSAREWTPGETVPVLELSPAVPGSGQVEQMSMLLQEQFGMIRSRHGGTN